MRGAVTAPCIEGPPFADAGCARWNDSIEPLTRTANGATGATECWARRWGCSPAV